MRIMGMGWLMAALAVGVAACGSSSSSHTQTPQQKAAAARALAQQRAKQQAQAAYRSCNQQVGPLLKVEQDLNSHLDVGLNYTEYTSRVGDVKAAYDQTPIHQLAFKCLTVGVPLESALNDFTKAAGVWNECFSNTDCSNDSIKPQLQAQWSKASDEISKAQSNLQAIKSGQAPAPPSS